MLLAYQHGAQLGGPAAGIALGNQGVSNINYVTHKYQPLINNAGIVSPQQQNN